MKYHSTPWFSATLVTCLLALPAQGASNRISKNFCRLMYADGQQASVAGNDYLNHGGSLDIYGIGSETEWYLVAQAPGNIYERLEDDQNDCGCHSSFGGCFNTVGATHPHGERMAVLHTRQHSVRGFGWEVGDRLVTGHYMAIEGDVGRTCGSTSPPRIGHGCISELSPETDNCGRHFHYANRYTRRDGTGIKQVPMLCGSPNLMLLGQNQTYTGAPCDPNGSAPTDYRLENRSMQGWGSFTVYQARETITVVSTSVTDSASVVVRAGGSIRLEPGFRAVADGSSPYFRAEIGPCNTTADRYARLWNVGDGPHDRARHGGGRTQAGGGPTPSRPSAHAGRLGHAASTHGG